MQRNIVGARNYMCPYCRYTWQDRAEPMECPNCGGKFKKSR